MTRADLASALVQANEEEKQHRLLGETRPTILTDEELYGNLFLFNLAGERLKYRMKEGTIADICRI